MHFPIPIVHNKFIIGGTLGYTGSKLWLNEEIQSFFSLWCLGKGNFKTVTQKNEFSSNGLCLGFLEGPKFLLKSTEFTKFDKKAGNFDPNFVESEGENQDFSVLFL